jgi:hypothetical protein
MAAACHAECTDELFKVDRAVLVRVEHVENIVCELAGIAKGKELLVYPTEFGLVELTGRTVLAETLVPLLQLLLVDCERSAGGTRVGESGRTVSVLLEICELLGRQLRLRFAHGGLN